MKKELPSIYKNSITKKNTHNKNIFYVKDSEDDHRKVEVLEEINGLMLYAEILQY